MTATSHARLIHYSAEPLGEILSVSQQPRSRVKPEGLWVATDEGWKELFQKRAWPRQRLRHQTKIILAREAKILNLSGANDIYGFTATHDLDHGMRIDWNGVAEQWHGIIIAPHCAEKAQSLSSIWYHFWDCASGCIWNAEAIERVEVMT